MKYYLSRGGQQYGPYTLEDLQRMKAQGQIDAADLTWGEGMPTWVPVSQVLEGAPATSAGMPQSSTPPPASPLSTPPQQSWTPSAQPYGGPGAQPYGAPALVPERGIRLLAYLIDIVPIIVCAVSFGWIPIVGRMLLSVVGAAYWLLRDYTGASLGKMALGLRVVATNGSESTINQRIMRNVPLAAGPLLGLIPFGGRLLGAGLSFIIVIVELVLVLAQGERLGDKLAGTIVVKKSALGAPFVNAAGR